MFDVATAPAEARQPDPDRAVPPCVGKVLGLVRTLIAYGQNLADTLRQHTTNPQVLPCFAFVANILGTTDLASILARITRGLLRAAALESRLNKRAARGRDLTPTPIRLPSARAPGSAKPTTPNSGPTEDLSPEEIIAKDRRRPIGAVLVDICLDLGIVPGQMDRAAWDELRRAVILYGGSLATLVIKREDKRRSADDPARGHPRLRSSLGDIEGLGRIPIAEWPKIEFPRMANGAPGIPNPCLHRPALTGSPSPCGRGKGEGLRTADPHKHGRDRPTASPAVLIRRVDRQVVAPPVVAADFTSLSRPAATARREHHLQT